jgi:hypothetical protein
MTMAAFAFGLLFAIPNESRAQAPKFQPVRLPWQTSANFTSAAPFDNDWKHVLSDTQRMLRRFAARYAFTDVLTVGSIVRTDAYNPHWIQPVSAYVPPTNQPPKVDVGTIRATMTPVEFASGVAAESRTLHGVLAGVQFELLD